MKNITSAFVWVWLPQESIPVVAGKLQQQDNGYTFVYGKSYRERSNAIALSPFELPLTDLPFEPSNMKIMPSCLRDALPDAWGRRLLDYQYPAFRPMELDYGLLSGSDRIGALDFQESAIEYKARDLGSVNLASVDTLAVALEKDERFPESLAPILLHGTSVGGARPKCLITVNKIDYLAKFSLSVDYYPFLKAEFIAMRLAKLAGVSVAEVLLKKIHDRDVLLVKRFDREYSEKKITRKLMLSGLSLLGLTEMEARYASYLDFADVIRMHFINPKAQLQELYKRLTFNILVGNTDDHARNHAAFWDGVSLTMTPAYDICPQLRVGFEATQAMRIEGEEGQYATLKNALSVCDHFSLTIKEARDIINHQINIIDNYFLSLCDEAGLDTREQDRLLGRVIKSDFCVRGF